MTEFTRLTLMRDQSRADVVVASDQPLAALMPRFCDILGLAPDSGPYALVRPIGDSLDLAGTSSDNGVTDGEIIYVVNWADIPAPPVVNDVPSTVSAVHDAIPAAWDKRAQQGVAAGIIAVVCLLGGLLAPWDNFAPWVLKAALPTGIAVLLALAVPLGRHVSTWVAAALTAAAAGLAIPCGLVLSSLFGPANTPYVAVYCIILLLCLTAGVGIGWGLRYPAAVLGALTSGACSALALVLVAVGLRPDEVWGVVGVVALIVLGLAPAWAISASGLTGLDDFTAGGTSVGRDKVITSTRHAYAMTTWVVAGAALLVGFSATLLALFSPNPWALGLAGAFSLVIVLRTRGLPLAVPVGTMWVAAVCGVGALLLRAPIWWTIAGFVVLVLAAAILVAVPIAAHIRVRLRGWGNLLESVALAATLPLLAGLFGVFGWLLGAFK